MYRSNEKKSHVYNTQTRSSMAQYLGVKGMLNNNKIQTLLLFCVHFHEYISFTC